MNGKNYSKQLGTDKGRATATEPDGPSTSPTRLDLRGVPCPLNWARAKVCLEQLPEGTILEIFLDDPKGARDLPGAAEAEGYDVSEVEERATEWRIVICK